ncbi:thioesterase family protein [Halioglobus sp.]|nr:thioesterase family protein [Halioglobus sp.]
MVEDFDFICALQPERIDELRFCGITPPLNIPTIYGGQLMAQVMYSAAQTLGSPRPAHHLQASFIASGDPTKRLDFEVSKLRDGKSTSNRQVEVSQAGTTLMVAAVSFQAPSEGYSHQVPMPAVDRPETLLEAGDHEMQFSDDDNAPFPFWIVVCPPTGDGREPYSSVWTKPRFNAAQDSLLQQMLFAFVSDASILQAALQPHSLTWEDHGLAIATMNHSLWFHRSLNINNWHLMHSVSPSTHDGRAFATATTFNGQGDLVATIAQEGILRRRPSQ